MFCRACMVATPTKDLNLNRDGSPKSQPFRLPASNAPSSLRTRIETFSQKSSNTILSHPFTNWTMGVEDFSALSSEYLFVDPEKIVNQKKFVPFATLSDVEVRRRKILKRTELPFWRILCYFEGTCLKAMSVDWLLWATLAVYVGLRIVLRQDGMFNVALDLGDTDITVLGAFLSFFLVLFVNQSNSRFHDMHKTSTRCPSLIYDITQICAPTFPKASASRLVRYLNAAHVAGYVGLSRTYSKEEFFDKLNEKFQLLTPMEMKRIQVMDMNYGSDAFHELVSWCMQDIEDAFKKGHIDAREKSALKDKTTQFRGAMDSLYDYCDQPIHFFYIHFLCLLSAVYLPLFAADNAFNAGTGYNVHWAWDVLSGMVVLVQAIFVIGLRLLGQKMSDPFGDDLEDLSVMHYVTECWKISNKMLANKRPTEEASEKAEEALKRNRKLLLGPEFDDPPPSQPLLNAPPPTQPLLDVPPPTQPVASLLDAPPPTQPVAFAVV